ncbi:AzlD domain-containing protein [Natronolimnobius sp. AArcel1]|uniref:AzlD family protein n=1 Tax=Natronolimnobius sp. AArcel1 TaxID=1679093 RepID=UPI0013EC4011|nr:AzlD domain-containing protein [Natronolimnobius sp. AArcel1]NGM68429.1 AzlD domain-containing protein [Natronolimnobius sp. AArcel1]
MTTDLPSALSLDPFIVGVILAMAAVTVLTKVGGIWLVRRVDLSERLEAGLSVLPGAIVIAILGPELAAGGPAEWGAAGLVLLVMWRTENILLALIAGVVGVVAFRAVV